jgi:phosphoribosyl-ATP pyrophosphohydrolase/phosphoribosyl-AMP cyclohydrolase
VALAEDGGQFVMACKDGDPSEIVGEAADLVFHLQVALAHHGVGWRQVQAVGGGKWGGLGVGHAASVSVV